MRRSLAWLPVVLMLLPATAAIEATTIVPAADPADLAMASEAVFVGRAGSSRTVGGSSYLATETELEILEVVKGPLQIGERVVVVAPGGMANGVGWAVAGSPRLAAGETYLFFADQDPSGRWRPRLLADSVLRRFTAKDGSSLLVPLDEASRIERLAVGGKGAALVPGPVRERRFIAALRQPAGEAGGWDWGPLVAPGELFPRALKAAPGGCAFMTYEELQMRWKKFDSGGSQSIWAEDDGEGLLHGGGFDQLSGAVGRWNGVGLTSLDLSYAGKKNFSFGTCGGGTLDDYPPAGSDIVVFNDPCDDIPDLSGCSGTLAFGGPWFSGTHSFDGASWRTIFSWFVIVNDGAGCLGSIYYEYMLTHELGHGLGFDHVSDPNALMNANCCNDHNALDNACTQYLYPAAAATPTPTMTPTPTVTPTPTPTATSGVPTPTPTPASSQVLVPVVVHQDGVGGTPWRSDVVVSNRNLGAQTLRLRFQPVGKAVLSATRTLAGLGTLLLEDLVTNLFQAGDARGPLAIEVVSGGSQLPVVVSRAYAENPFGNLGSGLPADLEATTDVVSLPGLFHDDVFRSNIAVTAGDGGGVWATFELFRGADGLVAGGIRRRIDAGREASWSIRQLFGGQAQPDVPMTVRVTLDNPGIVYASLIDQASTDPAVFFGMVPAISWIVPVVTRVPGLDGTFWRSEVSLWNAGGTVCWVDLEFLPEKQDNSRGGWLAARIRLDPYATMRIGDVLLERFGNTNGTGVLVVDATRPIAVTSRVFTSGPMGGISGNGVRSVLPSALRAGETVLPGVRLLDGFRTNIGVVTGSAWVEFGFELRDGGGTLRDTAYLRVPPRTLRHLSVNGLFGNDFVVPDPVGSIIVDGDGSYISYLTVIDGSSQDPVFVMPQ